MVRFVALGLSALLISGVAAQAGDAAKGKEVFQRCAICHTVVKDGGNGLGPNLFGVVGRKAGTAPGFSYSPAMKSAGITWTPDKLTAYVQHPGATVPANRMAFAGLGNPDQASDVVAYLATLK
jgi:cytochrome c